MANKKPASKTKPGIEFGPRPRSIPPTASDKHSIIYKSKISNKWYLRPHIRTPIVDDRFDEAIGAIILDVILSCEISKSSLLSAIEARYWHGYTSSSYVYISKKIYEVFNYLVNTTIIEYIPRKPLEINHHIN